MFAPNSNFDQRRLIQIKALARFRRIIIEFGVAASGTNEICRLRQENKDSVMNKQTMKFAVAVAVGSAVMFGSVLASGAAPLSSSMAILKQAAPSSGVTDVRYRRHYRRGYYGGPGAAIGLGILGAAAGAAAIGSGYYGPGYYGPGYYGPNYYGAPYPYRRRYYYPY